MSGITAASLSGSSFRLPPSPLPEPKVAVTIRPGVMSDVPFLDSLQKLHTKQVGWMPTKQFEGKIKAGHVLVAEMQNAECKMQNEGAAGEGPSSILHSAFCNLHSSSPVGYLIGNDQYFKRDDVGIIYQVNVKPGAQRGLIGASLLKAQFERSAYGCRLYCCWCAQDIAANKFWEAMGFVPLAFRAGSEKKARVHIFWQKRIRQGDTTTPWWFPSKTAGGAIREDRIVLPIPPGTHWSDAKPLILPAAEGRTEDLGLRTESKTRKPRKLAGPKATQSSALSPQSSSAKPVKRNGLMFDIPKQGEPLPPFDKAQGRETKPAKKPKPKAPKVKRTCDPRLVSAARELRDRWLEQVNADPSAILPCGRYEVSRALPAAVAGELPKLIAA